MPPSKPPLNSLHQINQLPQQIPYPLLLKPPSRPAPKPIPILKHPQQLQKSLKQPKTQPQKYFNHHTLYLQPFIPLPKHLQVQIIPHRKPNYLHLPETHSSVQ
ncbi:ATP-binding protein, partial [Staphylococcus haemolyticus]